jgi:hypothetical protein
MAPVSNMMLEKNVRTFRLPDDGPGTRCRKNVPGATLKQHTFVLEAAHGIVFLRSVRLVPLIRKLASYAIDKWSPKGPGSAIGRAMKRA